MSTPQRRTTSSLMGLSLTRLQEILQEFSHRCALVGTSKSSSVTVTSVSDEETHANRFEALNFYPTNEPIQKSTKTTPPVEKKESSSSSSVGFSNPNVIEDTIGDAASLLQIAQVCLPFFILREGRLTSPGNARARRNSLSNMG